MKRKHSLLFVDDELANLQKLQRTFIDTYTVHLARSGEEALELLKSVPVDAVITDQKMPKMNGVELLEASQKVCPDLVRIVLTGYTEVGDLIAAINSGNSGPSLAIMSKYKAWTFLEALPTPRASAMISSSGIRL